MELDGGCIHFTLAENDNEQLILTYRPLNAGGAMYRVTLTHYKGKRARTEDLGGTSLRTFLHMECSLVRHFKVAKNMVASNQI